MHPYKLDHEKTSQSRNPSPGVVGSGETLLRTGYHPEHTEDGMITSRAIPSEDLKERGFSVDRKEMVTRTVLRRRAENQMNNRPDLRKEAVISPFNCGDVRAIAYEGTRALIVVDSATPDNPAHASIYSLYGGDGRLKKIKTLLLPFLQDYEPLEEYIRKNIPNE